MIVRLMVMPVAAITGAAAAGRAWRRRTRAWVRPLPLAARMKSSPSTPTIAVRVSRSSSAASGSPVRIHGTTQRAGPAQRAVAERHVRRGMWTPMST